LSDFDSEPWAMMMTSRTHFFKNISILVMLVLPTLILIGYGLTLFTSYVSALLISVNEWWLYLIAIYIGILVVPLPPLTKNCAKSLHKVYAIFVQRFFSKGTQVFVIQDKVDLNSCQRTAFDDSTSDLPIIPPQTHSSIESASNRYESLSAFRSSVPSDPGHLISTFNSEFFLFKSFIAGCLFCVNRFVDSSFGMLARIGGEIVHSGKLKIKNYWIFR
jgi:hypothetical protein